MIVEAREDPESADRTHRASGMNAELADRLAIREVFRLIFLPGFRKNGAVPQRLYVFFVAASRSSEIPDQQCDPIVEGGGQGGLN